LPLADGFYSRDAGVNNVQPAFWFTLPADRGAGVVKVTGYMNPLLARLLPITLTAQSNASGPFQTVISEQGWFEFEVSCAAPADPGKADSIYFTVDKSLVPKSANISSDERALSIGIAKIEYLATSGDK
jgi:hypothetical protein